MSSVLHQITLGDNKTIPVQTQDSQFKDIEHGLRDLGWKRGKTSSLASSGQATEYANFIHLHRFDSYLEWH